MNSSSLIYKISPREPWSAALADGVFKGAPIDVADGYIHFSTAAQARETAAKHFAGKSELVIAAIDSAALSALKQDGGDDALVWEPSRGGQLFPHLYAPLDTKYVVWTQDLVLNDVGNHVFPAEMS